ncbi:hypothetical protein LSH36_880g00042 [Paralvinella palmiformis]|uniref:EF-hand domain-containing protein n=1 Tax=Paralvinella palmiformis TaxID=53620 RepID=A0AAD9IZP2_9ANNE|nr:hypothetical protein LSH36_880g00042 [Paralvinella palmiformis]
MGDEAKIRDIFKRFDRDGSGEISARELVEVLREADKTQNPGRDESQRDTIVKKKAGVNNIHRIGPIRVIISLYQQL